MGWKRLLARRTKRDSGGRRGVFPDAEDRTHVDEESESNDAVKIENLEAGDTVIAIMGPTGSGKSTFVSRASGRDISEIGHGLKSHTKGVIAIRFWDQESGRHIVLVDTPGFDDTKESDLHILNMISNWLVSSYDKKKLLSGILYLHRITDNRVAGTSLKNLRVFQKLCGKDALDQVYLTTTMWDEVEPSVGEKRLEELKADFWKVMINQGAQIARCQYNDESPRNLIRQIASPDATKNINDHGRLPRLRPAPEIGRGHFSQFSGAEKPTNADEARGPYDAIDAKDPNAQAAMNRGTMLAPHSDSSKGLGNQMTLSDELRESGISHGEIPTSQLPAETNEGLSSNSLDAGRGTHVSAIKEPHLKRDQGASSPHYGSHDHSPKRLADHIPPSEILAESNIPHEGAPTPQLPIRTGKDLSSHSSGVGKNTRVGDVQDPYGVTNANLEVKGVINQGASSTRYSSSGEQTVVLPDKSDATREGTSSQLPTEIEQGPVNTSTNKCTPFKSDDGSLQMVGDEQTIPSNDLQKSKSHPPKVRKQTNENEAREPRYVAGVEDLKADDIVIAVVGPIGSGKSMFVSFASGRGAMRQGSNPHTEQVTAVRIWDSLSGRHIVLVDTPGFDDTQESELDVLNMISDWLVSSYSKKKLLSGILYLHRMTDKHAADVSDKSLRVFQKLVGKDNLDKVCIITMIFDALENVGKGTSDDVRIEYWKALVDHGARTTRCRIDDDSPKQLIRQIVELETRKVLLIQEEMAELKKELKETAAGQQLYSHLEILVEKQMELLRRINKERKETSDTEILEELQTEYNILRAQIDDKMRQMQELKLSLPKRVLSGLQKRLKTDR